MLICSAISVTTTRNHTAGPAPELGDFINASLIPDRVTAVLISLAYTLLHHRLVTPRPIMSDTTIRHRLGRN